MKIIFEKEISPALIWHIWHVKKKRKGNTHGIIYKLYKQDKKINTFISCMKLFFSVSIIEILNHKNEISEMTIKVLVSLIE